MVDVICAVTRGASGCGGWIKVPVFGRGKRLVGEMDLGGCVSVLVIRED